jgi:hypothetical protein
MSVMAALVEQVASDTGDTVYRVRAAYDATPPYHVVEMVDSDRDHHLGGRSGKADSSIAIETFNSTPAGADAKANTIEAGIDGLNQQIGTGADAINVTVKQTGRTEGVHEARDASRADVYSVRMSFDVWHAV